jgi:hypothetical protein
LILKATLSYQGEGKTAVYQNLRGSNVSLKVPEGWRRRLLVRGSSGPRGATRIMSPGDQWSETLFVHHRWQDIPKGKVMLEVGWRVIDPGEKGKVIADPAVKLEVDIPPATKERVRALCQRLEERLGGNKLTEEERQKAAREVIDRVRYTNHAGLAPVVWRLIESFPDVHSVLDFLPMVYAAAEDKGAVNCRLVKLAHDPEYAQLDDIFWYWHREKIVFSPEEMAPLLRFENVWTRALICATFAGQCGKEWTERLFRDLRELQQPLPEKQFARLVSELDDDDFAVREKASKELIAAGPRASKQLEELLRHPTSAEVKDRVRHILDTLKQQEPSPQSKRVVAYLGNLDTPESAAILKLLADGTTDAWLAKDANTALDR